MQLLKLTHVQGHYTEERNSIANFYQAKRNVFNRPT